VKLHVLSDLHLEYRRPSELPRTDADVVVLAGDIDVGTDGVRWAARTFSKEVIYVPGNHEFYHQDAETLVPRLRAEARRTGHVHVLADEAWVFRGVRFLGTTLWTDFLLFGPEIRRQVMSHCEKMMADFRLIRQGRRRFTAEDWIALHERSLQWLTRTLAEPFPGPTVVVSHHLPSRRSVQARYTSAALSAAFGNDLEQLLSRKRVDLWVHGHTHASVSYSLEAAEVICNPRGYPTLTGQWENPEFRPDLVVNV
jgi:predicted phosphodiesterase